MRETDEVLVADPVGRMPLRGAGLLGRQRRERGAGDHHARQGHVHRSLVQGGLCQDIHDLIALLQPGFK